MGPREQEKRLSLELSLVKQMLVFSNFWLRFCRNVCGCWSCSSERSLCGSSEKAPCIVFIDELDAVAKSRSAGVLSTNDERESTLNQILVEMDGFDNHSGVIIMAATNRPEVLDPAILRPGRFDRQILVDRPTLKGREEILKVHGSRVKLENNIDFKEIASRTPMFTGADLANLVNEAALLAVRRDLTKVPRSCFEDAIDRIIAGLATKVESCQNLKKNSCLS